MCERVLSDTWTLPGKIYDVRVRVRAAPPLFLFCCFPSVCFCLFPFFYVCICLFVCCTCCGIWLQCEGHWEIMVIVAVGAELDSWSLYLFTHTHTHRDECAGVPHVVPCNSINTTGLIHWLIIRYCVCVFSLSLCLQLKPTHTHTQPGCSLYLITLMISFVFSALISVIYSNYRKTSNQI